MPPHLAMCGRVGDTDYAWCAAEHMKRKGMKRKRNII